MKDAMNVIEFLEKNLSGDEGKVGLRLTTDGDPGIDVGLYSTFIFNYNDDDDDDDDDDDYRDGSAEDAVVINTVTKEDIIYAVRVMLNV